MRNSLLQAEVFVVVVLKVADGIGEEFWQMLAGAFQSNRRHFTYIDIVTTRKGIAEAKKEDIKEIWDSFENSTSGLASLLLWWMACLLKHLDMTGRVHGQG